jgi:hypothetical protein
VAGLLAPLDRVDVTTDPPDRLPASYLTVNVGPAGWLQTRLDARGVMGTSLADWPTNGLAPEVVWVADNLGEHAAITAAHEVGHAVGLSHTDAVGNLMYGGGTTPQSTGLTPDQVSSAQRVIDQFENWENQ